ncbi:hypothetical protein L1987_64024 [Smallanthus sonchifolius]|uniref:Uncharacterized protein n=1 Tax=Smallanthus sonchifolius TaxID=185202 RepID=A0ACB9CF63_9ASTR|nr:hypothetical protein L1987_64024 [Smallanthus sonchifolius]
MGDGDEEARPKAPSRSKDSTIVDEDRLKLGTQTDAYLSTDATKKGEMVPMEEDSDSMDQRGYEVERIVKNMQKLQQQRTKLLRIGFSAASTLDAADRKIISSFGWSHLDAAPHLCC